MLPVQSDASNADVHAVQNGHLQHAFDHHEVTMWGSRDKIKSRPWRAWRVLVAELCVCQALDVLTFFESNSLIVQASLTTLTPSCWYSRELPGDPH